MKAVELRRQLLDEELEDIGRSGSRAMSESACLRIIDRLAADGALPAFSKSQKERMAYRAARLMSSNERPATAARAALARGKWRERAAAAASFMNGANPIRSAGSLSVGQADGLKEFRGTIDAAAVSRALATAIREVVTPGILEAQARINGDAAAALRNERGGAHVWEQALAPLMGEFALNAAGTGATRTEAALEALVAAAALTGRAKQGSADVLPFLLGAASRYALRAVSTPSPETAASARLARDLAATNSVRLVISEGLSGEDARLLGAAAACAVFGKGGLRPRAAAARPSTFDARTLPEDWLERFAHVSAADAAEELSFMAADPRASEDGRAIAESAAESAMAHHGAARVSFAEALGLEPPELRVAGMRPGRMFRASPRGRYQARVLCRGKNGRLIRCRAVADSAGSLVGYVAFDPLSREYGGRPLMAAYGLDGLRQGYAWADERLHWRAGAPEQGFVSVPESIPI